MPAVEPTDGDVHEHRLVADVRVLEVAGVRIAVEVPRELPWTWPDGPLTRFAGADAGRADVRVAVRIGKPVVSARALSYDSGGGIFDVVASRDTLEIVLRIRGEIQRVARFDRDFRDGEVTLAPDSFYATENYYPLAYPLDEWIFFHRILRESGLLVHACAAERSGRALLYCGRSGAGKSTTAKLLRRYADASVLSDDRIALRVEKDGIWAHGTPWHGEAPLSEPRAAKLVAIHWIEHAARLVHSPMRGARAAVALLGNAFLPAYDDKGAAAGLAVAEEIVARVPLAKLGFPKDRRMVDHAQSLWSNAGGSALA